MSQIQRKRISSRCVVVVTTGLSSATTEEITLKTESGPIFINICLTFFGFFKGIHGGYVVSYSRMNVGAPPGIAFASAPNRHPDPVETVRTFFPETWIWNLVETG